ncbi:3-hydroxyisobutyrate dehydrogenase, partial [Peribacillus frigoritolerans]
PAYCTELTNEELTKALEKANKEKAPFLRDKVIEKLSASNFTPLANKDIVNMNREIYNS